VTSGESSVGFVDSRVCARAAPGPPCDPEDGRGVKPGWVSFCLVDEVGAVSGAPLRVRLVQAPAISGACPVACASAAAGRFDACSAVPPPPAAGRSRKVLKPDTHGAAGMCQTGGSHLSSRMTTRCRRCPLRRMPTSWHAPMCPAGPRSRASALSASDGGARLAAPGGGAPAGVSPPGS